MADSFGPGQALSRLLPLLLSEFRRHFGAPGEEAVVAWAPGRVNLIGEHTDYNSGFVLPMAIDRGVALLFDPAPGQEVTLFSAAHQELASFPLDDIRPQPAAWINYPAGVAKELQAKGIPLRGGRGVVAGDVPVGSGLSSSAAIEVASAFAFLGLLGERGRGGLTPTEIALLCQRAENDFIGLKCGIMDQFISVHAKAGMALLLDCRDLSFQHLPVDADRYGFTIADSGIRRELASSAYNERRQQCEQAVATLARRRPEIHSLRDVSPQDLAEYQQDLPPVIHRRARHVVEEIARTVEAADALKSSDYAKFGCLMNQSHESLRELYEVSCLELDRLVEIARSNPGVLGSRLTGGGFGGCTVTLVEKEAAPGAMDNLRARYSQSFGRDPAVFFSSPAGGAERLLLSEATG